ncbi:hypothetical protein OG981_08045 [Streptomyces mirabilis]|uniref:hypothetical protein n=1 Tax=Streptomyces mirabilis TaxID=68239 RepID=UPI002E1E3705
MAVIQSRRRLASPPARKQVDAVVDDVASDDEAEFGYVHEGGVLGVAVPSLHEADLVAFEGEGVVVDHARHDDVVDDLLRELAVPEVHPVRGLVLR